MTRCDADLTEVAPVGGRQGVAFMSKVVDIIGGKHLVDDALVNALHGHKCFGEGLLHTPAVGIEFGIGSASDAGGPHVIDVEAVGKGLDTSGTEECHGGEEVVLGATQTIGKAQIVASKELAAICSLPYAYEMDRCGVESVEVEIVPAKHGCGRLYGVIGVGVSAFVVYPCAKSNDVLALEMRRKDGKCVGA